MTMSDNVSLACLWASLLSTEWQGDAAVGGVVDQINDPHCAVDRVGSRRLAVEDCLAPGGRGMGDQGSWPDEDRAARHRGRTAAPEYEEELLAHPDHSNPGVRLEPAQNLVFMRPGGQLSKGGVVVPIGLSLDEDAQVR